MSKLTIAFTGDIAFSAYYKGKEDDNFLSSEILDYLNEADEVISNIEAPITDKSVQSDRSLNHVNRPEIVGFLKKINSRYWNVANNHIMDCGEDGICDTISICEKNGSNILGLKNRSYCIIGNEIKIGIFAVTSPWEHLVDTKGNRITVTWNDDKLVSETINSIKEQCDKVVVLVHGGDEFCDIPLPYIRKIYQRFVLLGADVVVGHHPHVVQNYELFNGKYIFYSLGNFVFDTDYQRRQNHTDNGLLLRLIFSDDSNISWDFIPIKLDRNKMLVAKSEKHAIFISIAEKQYSRLWELSAYGLSNATRIALKYKHKKFNKYSKTKWIVRDIKNLNSPKGRDLFIGKCRFYLHKKQFNNNDSVVNYMISNVTESVKDGK